MLLVDHMLAELREGFTLDPNDDPVIPIGPPLSGDKCQYGPLGKGCFVREMKLSELMSSYGVPWERRFEIAPGYTSNEIVRGDYPANDRMWQSDGMVYKWSYLASLSIDRKIDYVPVNDTQSFWLGGCPGAAYSNTCTWASNTSCWTYLGNPSGRVTNMGAGPYCTATWMKWDTFWAWSPGAALQTEPLPAKYGGPSTSSSSTSSSSTSSSSGPLLKTSSVKMSSLYSSDSAMQIKAIAPSSTPPANPSNLWGLPSWAYLVLGIIGAMLLLFIISAFLGSSSPGVPSYTSSQGGPVIIRRVYYN